MAVKAAAMLYRVKVNENLPTRSIADQNRLNRSDLELMAVKAEDVEAEAVGAAGLVAVTATMASSAGHYPDDAYDNR